MLSFFLQTKPVPLSLLRYAACDVDHLLELRDATLRCLGQDYLPIVREMCEVSLLHRIADPFAKRVQRSWLAIEKADLFLDGLDVRSKGEVYAFVAGLMVDEAMDGPWLVLAEGSSAHVRFHSRQDAIKALLKMEALSAAPLGQPAIKAKLMREIKAE